MKKKPKIRKSRYFTITPWDVATGICCIKGSLLLELNLNKKKHYKAQLIVEEVKGS